MKSFNQLKEDLSTDSDTILVDGVSRSRFNSLGKPIYPTDQGVINFWKWFGNSQVVDKEGRPLVVYHGATNWETKDGRKLGDIHSFNRKASTEIVRRKGSIDQVGVWFSDKSGKEGAGMYGTSVYPAYLRILDYKRTTFIQLTRTAYKLAHGEWENDTKYGSQMAPNVENVEPYREYMKEQGYDGLQIIHDRDRQDQSTEFMNQTAWVVFEPNQIKSAIGNTGSFNIDSNDITEAVIKKPMYVHRPLLKPSVDMLLAWAKEQGFTKTLAPDDFHVTIVYSKKPIEWNKFTSDTTKFKNINDDRAMDKFGDAIVLKFKSPTLTKRHHQFKEGGASWDHPDYQPHITITYDGGDVNHTKIIPYDGVLLFGPEEFEELDEDWSDSIDEVVA